METIDISTGKASDNLSINGYALTLNGKVHDSVITLVQIPKVDSQRMAFYIMLHAIKKIKTTKNLGQIKFWTDLHRKEFSIGLMGWEFRAYFRLRTKTKDFVLVRTSFGGRTEAKLQYSKEYVEKVQKSLKFVEKFLSSQSKMDVKKYPYIPKYNEKGWK